METEDKLDLEVFVCTNLPQTPQEITALAIHSLSMPAANHNFPTSAARSLEILALYCSSLWRATEVVIF